MLCCASQTLLHEGRLISPTCGNVAERRPSPELSLEIASAEENHHISGLTSFQEHFALRCLKVHPLTQMLKGHPTFRALHGIHRLRVIIQLLPLPTLASPTLTSIGVNPKRHPSQMPCVLNSISESASQQTNL